MDNLDAKLGFTLNYFPQLVFTSLYLFFSHIKPTQHLAFQSFVCYTCLSYFSVHIRIITRIDRFRDEKKRIGRFPRV